MVMAFTGFLFQGNHFISVYNSYEEEDRSFEVLRI